MKKWNDYTPDEQRAKLNELGWHQLTFSQFAKGPMSDHKTINTPVGTLTNHGLHNPAFILQNWLYLHKQHVREALRLELDVPLEVMVEYPHFTKMIANGQPIRQMWNYDWCTCGSLLRPAHPPVALAHTVVEEVLKVINLDVPDGPLREALVEKVCKLLG